MNRWIRQTALALAVGLGLGVQAPVAVAQDSHGLGAFVGRWQINLDKSRMGRVSPTGQRTVRSATFTWVFTPDGPGLRWDIYAEYPQAAPTRSMALLADGQQRPCRVQGSCLSTGGDAREQSYAHFQTNSHLLTRVFYVKGQVAEYNTYAVSTDGKTFTTMSWSPQTPELQNVQVFERQQ